MGEENKVTRWSRWIRANLREVESLEVALLVPDRGNHHDSEVFAILEALCEWLNADVEGISNAKSIADIMDPTSGRVRVATEHSLPSEVSRASRFRLEYLHPVVEVGVIDRWAKRGQLGGGDHGTETFRISAEARSMSTREQEYVIGMVEDYLDRELPAGWRYYLAGSIPTYTEMMGSLQRYQLICFGLASVSCLALMSILFRSLRLSTFGLIPSFLPGIVAFGLLGWWDWGLDPASTMVATIILGVAVDDSIHLLSMIQRGVHQGAPLADVVRGSIRHVGQPVIVSSLVLAAAFWTLTISPSSSVATFGFLAGISIMVALVADLFVLPSLILRLGKISSSDHSSTVRELS
jgi:predicted RND superfamily exporter protein